jgi:hypothetical protein
MPPDIIYFIFSLLITVSCSSSSDDGGEVNTSFSQAGQALIEKALNTPRIFSQLISSSHAILSFIVSKNEYALSFYDFAVLFVIFPVRKPIKPKRS